MICKAVCMLRTLRFRIQVPPAEIGDFGSASDFESPVKSEDTSRHVTSRWVEKSKSAAVMIRNALKCIEMNGIDQAESSYIKFVSLTRMTYDKNNHFSFDFLENDLHWRSRSNCRASTWHSAAWRGPLVRKAETGVTWFDLSRHPLTNLTASFNIIRKHIQRPKDPKTNMRS